MKITNHKALAEHIGMWLQRRLTVREQLKTAVLGISGGVDSALVALLCKFNDIPFQSVNMPCHSSQWSVDRSLALADDYGFNVISVDVSAAADAISSQVDSALRGQPTRDDLGGLYSCIRTPALDYVAKRVDGMIIGTGNRDEDGLVRYFAKRGDGAVDLSPIADLHKSEVKQLFEWLAATLSGAKSYGELPASARGIIEAKPSADLFGGDEQTDEGDLGMSYDQVEWVDLFTQKHCPNFWSLSARDRESQLARVRGLSEDQAAIIRRVSSLEIATKHKENPSLPICLVHGVGDWFE